MNLRRQINTSRTPSATQGTRPELRGENSARAQSVSESSDFQLRMRSVEQSVRAATFGGAICDEEVRQSRMSGAVAFVRAKKLPLAVRGARL